MNLVWQKNDGQGGTILIMTLVFMVMFAVIFIALSGLTGLQYHEGSLAIHDELAFQMAEAGLNYGRWRLAHSPQNFSSETRTINDQFAGAVGSFTVSFAQPTAGSTVVIITSVGTTAATPGRPTTLKARYGIPSLAKYAFITNSDVWYAEDLHGAVHANGGIRMDGTSDSLMTSAKTTYTCQPSQGCSNVTKPGIWGTGQNAALWQFPVPPIDYNALTTDLATMKTKAQQASTYYAPSGKFGYHAVFNTNGTYTLYKVTKLMTAINSYTNESGWQLLTHDISTETLVGTYTVPTNGILFFEDTLWLQGTIVGRVLVAAGRFPDSPSTNADIIINGNITYGGVKDGTRVFGAVAQRDVLIPYYAAPNDLTLEGAFIAQKGRFGRRYYNSGSNNLLHSLTLYGMTASNLVPATAWVDGNGNVTSGYPTGTTSYDSNLLYGPPPYFPVSGQYDFISWEQQL